MARQRQRILSITKKDFIRSTFKGSGKGGQKRNKTSNGVRFFHPPSGASGEAVDQREQSQNEKIAFNRLVKSNAFQSWLSLEIDCKMGKVKLEVSDEHGNWTEQPCHSQQ